MCLAAAGILAHPLCRSPSRFRIVMNGRSETVANRERQRLGVGHTAAGLHEILTRFPNPLRVQS